MARSVRYHPGFDADVLDAAQWYDDRSAHLGSDFVARVRKATAELIADPARRTTVEYGLRYWPVARFPYVVFYDFTDTEVIVLGAMHTSQQLRNGLLVADNQAVNVSQEARCFKWVGLWAKRRRVKFSSGLLLCHVVSR